MQRAARMKRELKMLSENPPFGISCWPKEDKIDLLEAQIVGGEGTPYEKGIFKLEIQLPERYPFEPPKVRFVTQIYHPNIDNGGRICLDTLKMPPKGAWKPCLNISTVLTSIQLLMAEPNPEDPLMTDISNEYKYNKTVFIHHAQQSTQKYAIQTNVKNENCGLEDEENKNKKRKKLEDKTTTDDAKRVKPMEEVTNITRS
ncbi:hypothetical protein SNE40_002196 [Patella caerulea]|uniref:Ubiquitin-conjugating enzyme E2 T n=1 Tax=Patella caerulea TaxID=87958 RepID=A0AAN8K5C1_PATCE